jgi:phosphate transport system substrate-binding protein
MAEAKMNSNSGICNIANLPDLRQLGRVPRALAAILPALAAAAIAAADPPPVDPLLPGYVPAGALQGEILIARSASTQTLVDSWGRAFSQIHPGVRVRQTAQATDLPAKCLAELCDGTVQLAPFVREIQPSEREASRRALGYDPLALAIASGSYATPSNTHAIAIYVNAANPLGQLTLAQLDAIYSSTRRRGAPKDLVRWGQLGLTGEWADTPIHAYGMIVNRKVGNPHAGIVAYLMERLMLGGEFKAETRQVPDTGMGRGNNRALDEIVQAVAADRSGIGYSGFANRIAGTKTLALAESAAGPYCAGTRDEVAERVYPLTRTIFILARRPPGRPLAPVLREFLRYILSRPGQEAVALDPANFLPLPAAFAAGERAKLD